MVPNQSGDPPRLYEAATASFNISDPTEALGNLLKVATDLLDSDRAALYELDTEEGAFRPRFTLGVKLDELGLLSPSTEHPILKEILYDPQAICTQDEHSALGLPLGPGEVACVACISCGQTVGLLFVGRNSRQQYCQQELATLEVISTRVADVLSFARQSASQAHLCHILSLLYQVGHAISSTRDRDETLRQIAVHLIKATSADACEMLLIEEGAPQSIRYEQKASESIQPIVISMQVEEFPDYKVNDQVLQDLEPAFLNVSPRVGDDEDIALLESQEACAAAIFPLMARDENLGLVRLLYKSHGRQINEQEQDLAQAIISIGAMGLQDAIHIETSQSRTNQLQTLSEIGREMTSTLDLEVALRNSMRHAHSLLQSQACILFLMDESREKLVIKASGGSPTHIQDVAIETDEGIAGWVIRNRRSLIVNDVFANPHYHSSIDRQTGLLTSSVLCVPLESRGEILGVIEAINHPRGAYTESDQQLLEAVAAWAAIALDNANLFRRVADERARLEATLVETADSVILTDPTGRIILINKAAALAFRVKAEESVSRLASEVLPNNPLGILLEDESANLPSTLETKTPRDRILFASVSEVQGVGRVAVMQDITALKQVDRMRSQLLGTAAHDLKNPLNAIRLGADLLSDAELSEPQRNALDMMQRATVSMASLISGLLETIRVESTANLVLEPCQISGLIERIIEDLRPLADARGHTTEFIRCKEPVVVMAEPNRLVSVISNLLSNAIKFTDPGGLIVVSLEETEEELVVSIQDNGPGIPPDEISHVFEHLFRGQAVVRDPNNPVEGTGLGLSLAKTAIEQHGGQIWVESEVNQGSKFCFSLPLDPLPMLTPAIQTV